MRKLHLVLLISALAIVATSIGSIGASGEITPLMGQIQIERPTWIPVASGAIELTYGGNYRFSIWRNSRNCLLVAFHLRIPVENHPAIHGIFGSGGNNWIITDTLISDMWVTVLTTFIYPSDFSNALGIKRDVFSQEEWAVNVVIKKMGSLGRVTRWELIR